MLFPKYSINYYSNGDSGKKNLTLTDKLCSLLSFSITTNSHFKKFHEKILIVPPSINTSIQKHVYFSVHLYFMAKRLREQWEKFSEWKLLVVVLPSNTFISYWHLSHWKFFLPFKNSIMNLSVSSFVFYCFFLCFAYLGLKNQKTLTLIIIFTSNPVEWHFFSIHVHRKHNFLFFFKGTFQDLQSEMLRNFLAQIF